MQCINIFLIILSIMSALIVAVAVVFSEEIKSTREKDPAAKGYLQVILFYPGLHALIAYRIAHALWNSKLSIISNAISRQHVL